MIYEQQRELDKLVAEHIMGWSSLQWKRHPFGPARWQTEDDAWDWWGLAPGTPVLGQVPDYSTRIEDAWCVLSKLRSPRLQRLDEVGIEATDVLTGQVAKSLKQPWWCRAGMAYGSASVVGCHESAPYVICEVALLSEGLELPEWMQDAN